MTSPSEHPQDFRPDSASPSSGMFLVRESEVVHGYSLAERVVRVFLWLALLASVGSCLLIIREHWQITGLLEQIDQTSSASEVLLSLREEVDVQLPATALVSIIVGVGLLTFRWLHHRFVRSQSALRDIKLLAHDILASMERGVVTTSSDGLITSMNSAANRLLRSAGDGIGRPLALVCPPEIPLAAIHADVMDHEATVRDRDCVVMPNGQRQRLRIDGHVLRDVAGHVTGSVLHLQDVTRLMLIEERMQRMSRNLKLATLSTGLHHEIKNPLTALSIHLQLLDEALEQRRSDGSVEECLAVLKTEINRLNGVLENFRTFANWQHLDRAPVDVPDLMDKVLRLIRPQAEQHGIQIETELPAEPLPLVEMDEEKIQQSLLNLVINALEAMSGGGVLRLKAALEDSDLQITIEDTGPGIPPDAQPQLFQPYFSTRSGGTGMGLALSEKLVTQHGGRITFTTSPAGTAFTIAIPLEKADAELPGGQEPAL